MANNKKKKKLPGGGKLGDTLKLIGDTALSTVGATDVIGDSAYKNQGFADASIVGEQVGLGIGKVAGSALGLGSAVSMGQQAIGSLDGQDKDRARMEELRANPQASGRYAQSIGQMNKGIQPLAGGIGAIGQIGAGFMGNLGQQGDTSNAAGIAGNTLKQFPLGGLINNVNVNEQVASGSNRHKALQQHQTDLDAYTQWQEQMQPYTDAYGEPTRYNKEELGNKFSDWKQNYQDDYNALSEDQSYYAYNTVGNTVNSYNNPNQSIGTQTGKGDDVYSFYSGPNNPGAVPAYDLQEEQDFNTIEAEQTQRQAFAPLKGGKGVANVGTITGYDGNYGEQPSGLNVLPPENNTGDTFSPSQFKGEIGILSKDIRPYTSQIAESQRSNQLDTFAYGGPINQMPDGGKFVEYEGPTHDNGGVDVNAAGIPTNGEATAEVEGGETMHDNGIESYIFSDRLIVNPGDKKKKTFSDESKKINNKYKGAENDKIAEDTRKLELETLKQKQEELKILMGGNVQNNISAYGGNLPTQSQGGGTGDGYAYGGNISKYPGGGELNPLLLRKEQPFNLNIYGYNNPIEATFRQQQSVNNPYVFGSEYNNSGLQSLVKRPEDTFKLQGESENVPRETILPQDKINPAGYLASNIGNVNDLIEAGQSTDTNDFGRMNANLVDYSAQRKELEKQAGVSRAISRENARNSGGAGSAMTNQVIANALVGSNLGSGLSESYMTEANTNAQIKNQAEQVNHQTRIQEKLADQQDLAKRKSTISQAMHSIGMNTQGYTKDLESARVGNINNKMWFDAIKDGKYLDLQYDEETGSTIIVNKNGDVWGRDSQGNITEAKKNK